MYCFLHPEDYSSNVEYTNKKEKKDEEEGEANQEEEEEEDEHSDDEIAEISPDNEVSSNLALKLLVSI